MELNKDITFQTSDYICIGIALFLLVVTWCYIIISYPYLPETIAVHFNESGQPDGYNSKNSIWIPPILFSVLSIGFIFGAKKPESINIPYKKMTFIEKKTSSKKFLFSSILLSVLLFLISLSMIETSLNRSFPTKWIIPTIIILVILYLAGVFYNQIKQKRRR